MRVSRGAYEGRRAASRAELPGSRSADGSTGCGCPGGGEPDHRPRASDPQGIGGGSECRTGRGDVVDEEHRHRDSSPCAEPRSREPSSPTETGLWGAGPAGQQPSTPAPQSSRHRAGQQLGVVEAAVAPATRGRRRPCHDRRERRLERRDHGICDPTDRAMGTSVLHASDDLAHDPDVCERRRPPVDAQRRRTRAGGLESGRADGAHRSGTTTPGADQRQEREQHPPNVRPGCDSRPGPGRPGPAS